MGVVALWVLMGTKKREDESCRNTKSRTPNVTDQKPQIGHGQILYIYHCRYFIMCTVTSINAGETVGEIPRPQLCNLR